MRDFRSCTNHCDLRRCEPCSARSGCRRDMPRRHDPITRGSMNYEVLIVDDHPLYRLALKGAVAAACTNCEIFEADSVAGLFDALDQHPRVDLLLLDLNLPGAYGFNALAHLRGSRPELPIIVVSASGGPTTMRRALAFGAQGFVSKSADAAAIGHNVQAVLRGEVLTPAGLGVEIES